MRSATASPLRLALFTAVLAVAFAVAAPPAAAQEGEAAAAVVASPTAGPSPAAAGDAPEDSEPYPYADALERDTPRGAMRGFLTAARGNDWQRAARYLAFDRLPPEERAEQGPRSARELKRVLDRALWIEPETLTDRPEGDTGDALTEGVDRVGSIATAGGEVPVQLRRVAEEGERVWKLSAGTVAQIGELYAEFGYGPLEDWLPPPFFEWQLLEIQLWQWIALVLLLIAAWMLSWLGAQAVLAAVAPLARRTDTEMDDRLLAGSAPPLRFLVGLGFFAFGLQWLRLSVPAEDFWVGAAKAATVIAALWLAMRLADLLSQWAGERLERHGQYSAVSLLPIGRRTLKVALFAIGVLAVLQNMGVNVTAILAGLGVGGLAVALAAQKSLENLFGGIMLAVDQPVRVGEFCRFGDQKGTVEDIGLRSTRVRTLDRTVITVPNADFSSMQLENYAERDRMRLLLTLGLRYETSPDQLRFVLVEIRRLLFSHPMVLDDPCRVRFVDFGAHSLDLEIFAYVDSDDFDVFLAVREDVYLRIMDVVAESGSDFAFPSQTLYLERGSGLDAERVRSVEEKVRAWVDAGELQLPDFSPELIADLAGKLDYPPRGSALRRTTE